MQYVLKTFKLPVYWTGTTFRENWNSQSLHLKKYNFYPKVTTWTIANFSYLYLKPPNMWFHKICTFFPTVQYHNKHYSGVLKEAQMTCFIKPVSRKIAVLMNAFFNCWLGQKIDLWKARKAFAACMSLILFCSHVRMHACIICSFIRRAKANF